MNKLSYVGSLIAFMIILPISAQSTSIPYRGPIPFSAYDKDGDELISEKEFSEARAVRMSKGAAKAPSFSVIDTNNNGTLTRDELAVGQKSQKEKRRAIKNGMNKSKNMGNNMPSFSDFDINGDGKILETEFNEARGKRIRERATQGYKMKNIGNASSFSDIDTNGDGQISEKEFTAHQSEHRQQKANLSINCAIFYLYV